MDSSNLTSQRKESYESYDENLNPQETKYEIKTEHCGYLNVYVQGDMDQMMPTTPVFLTLHDLATNHHEFHKLVEHPCMEKIKSRSIWVHVDLPGQQFEAEDLPNSFEFPSLDKIARDMVNVLNHLNIKYCITLGDGAGANILIRFAMEYPERVLGNILINCVASVESMMKYFHDKIISWRLNTIGMNSTADQYLVYHRFGTYIDSRKDLITEKTINQFLERLHKRMNPKNLRLYVHAYLSRNDLSGNLREKLRVDTMLVAGTSQASVQMADEMKSQINPKYITLVLIEQCGSVFSHMPDTFAYDLLLFCQGLGMFAALPISRHNSICV